MRSGRKGDVPIADDLRVPSCGLLGIEALLPIMLARWRRRRRAARACS